MEGRDKLLGQSAILLIFVIYTCSNVYSNIYIYIYIYTHLFALNSDQRQIASFSSSVMYMSREFNAKCI
jgi:hypothetical protein